jgi:hypothetical protein
MLMPRTLVDTGRPGDHRSMGDLVRAAARNNAAWCEAVWRSHALATIRASDFWATAARAPAMYPDAVTLEPGVEAAAVLARLDDSSGCSIKDSFADLDLRPDGYEVLFEAAWYACSPVRGGLASDDWSVVRLPEDLAAWARAHGGGEVFRPGLLDDPAVRFLVRRDRDRCVAGAVANMGGGVVGVSNVFSLGPAETRWDGLIAAVGRRFPGRTIVGYDAGLDLAVAVRAGFAPIGPLRVWRRE